MSNKRIIKTILNAQRLCTYDWKNGDYIFMNNLRTKIIQYLQST